MKLELLRPPTEIEAAVAFEPITCVFGSHRSAAVDAERRWLRVWRLKGYNDSHRQLSLSEYITGTPLGIIRDIGYENAGLYEGVDGEPSA